MPSRISAHFGRIADEYDQVRDRWPQRLLRKQEEEAVRLLVDVRQGQRVLDAGCGNGATLAWLTTQGARGVGVDLTWAMAAACRRSGFAVCVQDFARLGFQPCFDWVLCIGALEFTEDPAAAIADLARCLHRNGRLALLFPHRQWLGWVYVAYHRRHRVRARLFSRGQVTAWLQAAGLHPQAWRECTLSTVCVAAAANPSSA